jgi:hypothetical protein
LQDPPKFTQIWGGCYDFLYVFAKIFRERLPFFAQTTASFCKILIITLVFEKKRQFFRLNLAKIPENCDHNIDPWIFGLEMYHLATLPA